MNSLRFQRGAGGHLAITQTQLRFGAISGTLNLINCPDVAPLIVQTFRGWDVSFGLSSIPPTLATVEKKRRYFHWDARQAEVPDSWRNRPVHRDFELLCDIHFEASDWYLKRYRGHLCLHCSAVRFGDQLVLFPADKKAGKSTLTMRLAQQGHRVYGDDVVLIEPKSGHALSLGLMTRLRLPLPASEGKSYARFVESKPGPADKKYKYVCLNDQEFAPLGEGLPIGAIVLLNRDGSDASHLEPVNRGLAVMHMIRKNFSRDMKASAIFDKVMRATSPSTFHRLTYARCGDAIALLQREFGQP
jgi:hypothetical protein